MKSFSNIDEYIRLFPEDVQEKLKELRKGIKDTAVDATETISWQMPTFRLNKNLVHFAVHKNHIGIYPGAEAIEAFKDELRGYKTSKGAIQFPLDKNIPGDLIKKIVEFNVERDKNI